MQFPNYTRIDKFGLIYKSNGFKRVKWSVLLFLCFLSNNSFGQGFSPYYTNTTYQKYQNYLVNSGRLKVNHPLSQPYSVGELSDSLAARRISSELRAQGAGLRDQGAGSKEQGVLSKETGNLVKVTCSDKWASLLRADFDKRYLKSAKQDSVKGNLIIGIEAGNKNNYNQKTNTNDFSGGGFASYAFKNFGLYSSINIDEAYKRDTMYFGSTGKLENKVFSRSNESYLQWENKSFVLFAGRINRNYGLSGDNSLILSDNPFSFDHFAFTFKNRVLKYTAIFGRLNDIYGFDIRDSLPAFQWNKRFLSIHRFEVSLSKKIEIGFTDVILFGGKDAFPQLQYLNPVNFLFMSKMSDRKGYEEGNANALMSFDFYYKPLNKLTFFGQFLIDDMDFTKSLRAVFPDRIGYTAKAIYTDLFPESQISLSYNKISNWTYNSFYTWGNYTYYGKSLGYPRNGSENIKLGFDSFKFFPFMLGFEVMADQYCNQDLNAPFVAVKTNFPLGIPEKSLSLKFNTSFIPNSFFSANLTTEYICYNNFGFIQYQKQSFFNIFLTLKMQGVFKLF